jgi:hypothetical protein
VTSSLTQSVLASSSGSWPAWQAADAVPTGSSSSCLLWLSPEDSRARAWSSSGR